MSGNCGRDKKTMSFGSSLVINYFAFSLALDYSIVTPTIQQLWTTLGGGPSFYGFMYGSYALAQCVMSPLLGYISDIKGLKFSLLLSVFLNSIGNVLYGLSFVTKSLNVMLLGRFVAGLGAGAICLGLVYLTNISLREHRGKVVAGYFIAQSIGFLGGPLIGMTLTVINTPPLNSTALPSRVVNLFTVPSWVTFINGLTFLLPCICIGFKNPMSAHMAMKFSIKDASELVRHVVVQIMIIFIAVTCFWGVTSDTFVLAFGQYHIITSKQDNWKAFVSGGLSFVITGIVLKVTIQRRISAALYTILGLSFQVLGFMLLLDYNIHINSPPNGWFFHSGMALAYSGSACFFVGSGTYFSVKVTDFSYQARNRRGFFLCLFNFAEALGRFVGPCVVSIVMYIEKRRKQVIDDCKPREFISKACHIKNVNIVLPVLAGILIFLTIMFILYHLRHGKWQIDLSLLGNLEVPPPSLTQPADTHPAIVERGRLRLASLQDQPIRERGDSFVEGFEELTLT